MSELFETDSEISQYSLPYKVDELPGIYFTENLEDKIKIYFKPKDVIEHVDPELKFKCTIMKQEHCGRIFWNIKYCSFPHHYRWRVYEYFWTDDWYSVTNIDLLNDAVVFIHTVLMEWSEKEEERMVKLERDYRAGLVKLHELDEPYILNPEELAEAKRKRQVILDRMIPPPGSILSKYKPMRIDSPRTLYFL